MYLCYGLMMYTEPAEELVAEERANANTEPIPVPLDEAGLPELLSTTRNDIHKTKIVQSMLREYCTAHLCELHLNLFTFTELLLT